MILFLFTIWWLSALYNWWVLRPICDIPKRLYYTVIFFPVWNTWFTVTSAYNIIKMLIKTLKEKK